MKNRVIFFASIIILIMVLGGILSAKYIKAEETKDSIKLGNKYLQEGKYEEAILAFQKAIQVDKKNIDARVGIAKAYISSKQYDKAEDVLKEAMDVDTKNPKPRGELVKLYILQGKEYLAAQKYEEAQNSFNKAVELSKYNPLTYLDISENYVSIHQVDKAVKILGIGYRETKDEKIKKRLEELNEKIRKREPVSFMLNNTNKPPIGTGLGEAINNELWVKYSDGKEELLVASRDDEDMKNRIAEIHDPQLTLDKKKVYFRCLAAAVSDAIHVVDIETKNVHFVCYGNYLKVIQKGEYCGKLIVNQHRYYNEGGAYDHFYIVNEQGVEIKYLGENVEDLNQY